MSEEDRELLARIGQLAGQINRHKNQQAGVQSTPSYPTNRYRGNAYRQASAPYPGRGFRGGRPPTAVHHRHRTLHLNPSASASNSSSPAASPGPSTTTPGWVAKNDRHRQLINANVYEKEIQNRSKAIEETRQRKLKEQRHREKTRFNEFLQHQTGVASSAHSNFSSGPNEIAVNGVRFLVMDGGKKLVKAADDRNSLSMTPKTTTVAGVKFHRTKTGNLVAGRIVKGHRQSGMVKKVDQLCKIFSTTGNSSSELGAANLFRYYNAPGSCSKGPACRYLHNPNKVALCKDFLKDGKCPNGESCDLSHEPTPERVPNCLHYAKGNCTKPDCLYTHSKAPPGAPVCKAFGFCGYCDKGADCTERHVFECPDFSNTGVCKVRGCKLLHRERASVLRNQMKQQDEAEDVSSDDDSADSDDVDSDEVAEFMEVDDDSDFEDNQNFLPL
ncbi:Zinc finger CCCH domain-containing protein [Cladobotryum mycophilum]|uniref:Zinc finger CCCH domain-containing protein n=1 Tax=Cladobotryum mycophilum TaxID=491253 RepID=A0ABR0SEQ9_9HYPO